MGSGQGTGGIASEGTMQQMLGVLRQILTANGIELQPSTDQTINVATTLDGSGNVVQVIEHNVTTGITTTTNYTQTVVS